MYGAPSRTAARSQPWGRLCAERISRCYRVRRTALFIAASLAILPTVLPAQGFRGTATTTTRYLELRPIVRDTVSRVRVTELPDGTLEFEGRPVTCVTGLPCVFYRPGEVQSATFASQDVGLTAWGFGVTGLSTTILLRARADLAGEFEWPQSDDPFDAVLAFAQYNRGMLRARAGRQQNISGLGFSGYDGLNLLAEPLANLELEAYAGRSLLRGTVEPRTEALRGVEEFAFDSAAGEIFLFGGSARWEPRGGTALAVRYQRELRGWRGAIGAERASFDVSTDAARPLRLEAAVDYDVAFDQVGKAHVRAQLPLLHSRLFLDATARRYQPWFDLFTIWGFFSPVAYHEGELRATWAALPSLRVWGAGAFRRYEESNAPIVLGGVERESARGELGAEWLLGPQFTFDGEYRWESGAGAFLSSGDATLQWSPVARVSLFVNGTAFQQIEEYRLGEGVVLGFGGGADVELLPRTRLLAGANLYRQNFENRTSAADWNQLRAFASLNIGFGEDPGAARRPGRIR
jgi:hypothetical protein